MEETSLSQPKTLTGFYFNMTVPTITEIILARHGQTDYNLSGRYQGVMYDNPLNAQGYRDAQALRDALHDTHLDAILVSPAVRTIESARPTALDHCLPLIPDYDLRERDHGDLNGRYFAELGISDSHHRYYEGGNVENGEPLEEVQERAEHLHSWIVHHYPGKRLLVVGHGALLGLWVTGLKGFGLQYCPEHILQNGRFHQLLLNEQGELLEARLNSSVV